ncbi:hypothetical protein N7492_009792 [Penicillium capsulatum]|uniref:Uncharacterized protein n=1 Tax=Penicillium capsulatum TaxID=69766 RepID=A0A9W9LFL7_9EURO|nr:hypothetical protein N7492_009792 [Penicillium capsulatum]
MAGRAETRTPEPPDRDEHEDSPPRLDRHCSEKDTLPTEEENPTRTSGQRDAETSDDSSTASQDLDTDKLVNELAKLRKEVRRDELHKEEHRKAKEEFSAALAEVRHELQTLTDRTPTPQPHSETCSQNSHDEILREIQSLRDTISPSGTSRSPSYADVARTPPTSHASNIRTLSSSNTTPTNFTDTLYCTIDTSKMADKWNREAIRRSNPGDG